MLRKRVYGVDANASETRYFGVYLHDFNTHFIISTSSSVWMENKRRAK